MKELFVWSAEHISSNTQMTEPTRENIATHYTFSVKQFELFLPEHLLFTD